eukprot:scaffold7376_cov200-Skeletonema_menzelii.AAC.1
MRSILGCKVVSWFLSIESLLNPHSPVQCPWSWSEQRTRVEIGWKLEGREAGKSPRTETIKICHPHPTLVSSAYSLH